jgi:glucosylglycerol 3-phosphatase
MAKLHQESFSLDHKSLIELLATRENILIIQDLDGVCMGLVKNPLTRRIDIDYLKATQAFDEHFFVLTNGEHIGKRGVRGIVERAFDDVDLVKKQGFYLPGLAGGGVQWQDRYGNVSHPGVSDAEMAFLEAVPQKIEESLKDFFVDNDSGISTGELNDHIQATVLDNKVSPTVNLNVFYDVLNDDYLYRKLQQSMEKLTQNLLQEAEDIGLEDSFFIHFAPNLGRDEQGNEIIQPASENDSGTTDLQFMLKGAIKEAGVPYILNHYYYKQTGNYPLGKDFNSRQAPQNKKELIALIKDNFDPEKMPTIIGVGDTVTSKAEKNGSGLIFRRGGSDRGFLELIKAIGEKLETENLVLYVDSSAGEVRNRKPLKLNENKTQVVEGVGDARDKDDPLTINVAFPGGYQQYTQVFQEAASRRKQ